MAVSFGVQHRTRCCCCLNSRTTTGIKIIGLQRRLSHLSYSHMREDHCGQAYLESWERHGLMIEDVIKGYIVVFLTGLLNERTRSTERSHGSSVLIQNGNGEGDVWGPLRCFFVFVTTISGFPPLIVYVINCCFLADPSSDHRSVYLWAAQHLYANEDLYTTTRTRGCVKQVRQRKKSDHGGIQHLCCQLTTTIFVESLFNFASRNTLRSHDSIGITLPTFHADHLYCCKNACKL